MENPFQEINQKLDRVLAENQKLLSIIQNSASTPERIPLAKFCEEYEITRPTAYAWNDRGLIRFEKVGGRQFVIVGSISVVKRYQREPAEA
jgi:hypothetical protein